MRRSARSRFFTVLFAAGLALPGTAAIAQGPVVWRSGRIYFPNYVSVSAFNIQPVEAITMLDWGDIRPDTPIGAVSFETCLFAPEGPVPGVFANVRLFDADNGNNTTTRVQLGPTGSAQLMGSGDSFPLCRNRYISTVRYDPPIELGDTDGLPAIQGTIFNPFSFADIDDDGRHDFSYSLDFDYPAPLVDPRSQAVLLTGVPAAGPSGGNRLTDLFVDGTYAGTTDLFRNIFLLAHGPGCNIADHAQPFGVLDTADIGEFIDLFLSGDAAADQADPVFTIDLADLVVFVEAFVSGCP